MKKVIFLIAFLIITASGAFAQLTLRVTAVPANTPMGDTIFLAGTFNNWNPSDANFILRRQNDGSYSITFTPSVGAHQYKFTRNGWTKVEGSVACAEIGNRNLTYSSGTQTVDNQILGWKDLGCNANTPPNVRIISNAFAMPQLGGRTRRIWAYLPPNYASDTTKRFPVMYMHDAQNLFDPNTAFGGNEWRVDETLTGLFQQGDKGCIVIGIDNGGGSRINEYSAYRNAQYGGGEGKAYSQFIAQTLKPYIDANFRTKSDRLSTGIGGSSLGGLISMYAAAEYQSVFSKALIFSPSFWFHDSCFTQVQLRGKQATMRYYFMAGTGESSGMIPDINRMVGILRGAGFTDDEIKVVAKADGQHAEWFWAREFGGGYQWLFREGTTRTDIGVIDTKVKVYPNPTDSVLKFETKENIDYINLELYDILGRLMNVQPLQPSRSFDVSYLKSGTYLVRGVRANQLLFTEKFVKR